MKIVQFTNGVVVDIFNAREDTTIDTIVVVNSIPTFEPKEGFNGVLKYNDEKGLYWEYMEVEASNEITNEEFINMLEEVL